MDSRACVCKKLALRTTLETKQTSGIISDLGKIQDWALLRNWQLLCLDSDTVYAHRVPVMEFLFIFVFQLLRQRTYVHSQSWKSRIFQEINSPLFWQSKQNIYFAWLNARNSISLSDLNGNNSHLLPSLPYEKCLAISVLACRKKDPFSYTEKEETKQINEKIRVSCSCRLVKLKPGWSLTTSRFVDIG